MWEGEEMGDFGLLFGYLALMFDVLISFASMLTFANWY